MLGNFRKITSFRHFVLKKKLPVIKPYSKIRSNLPYTPPIIYVPPASGGFAGREQALENMYIREHEKQKRIEEQAKKDKLRKK